MKPEGRLLELPAGYIVILADLKDQIRVARMRAGLAVNRELVLLYWRIGQADSRAATSGGMRLQGY